MKLSKEDLTPVQYQVKNKVWAKMCEQVNHQVRIQVSNQIWIQISTQVWAQLRNKINETI